MIGGAYELFIPGILSSPVSGEKLHPGVGAAAPDAAIPERPYRRPRKGAGLPADRAARAVGAHLRRRCSAPIRQGLFEGPRGHAAGVLRHLPEPEGGPADRGGGVPGPGPAAEGCGPVSTALPPYPDRPYGRGQRRSPPSPAAGHGGSGHRGLSQGPAGRGSSGLLPGGGGPGHGQGVPFLRLWAGGRPPPGGV